VVEADDGAAALRQLAAHPVDLAVVDVMMPGVDGFELVGRLRINSDILWGSITLHSPPEQAFRPRDRCTVGGLPACTRKAAWLGRTHPKGPGRPSTYVSPTHRAACAQNNDRTLKQRCRVRIVVTTVHYSSDQHV
jgi:hypothetical protein